MKYMMLLLVPLVLANPYYAQELELGVNISNNIYIIPQDGDWRLRSVRAMLSFYPHDDFRQDVLSIDSSPSYVEKEDSYEFEWHNVNADDLMFMVMSRIRTRDDLIKVREKVDFPSKGLTSELKEYVKTTPTIDYSDPDILRLASKLAYGEDDQYRIVHKLGSWVNQNIEYDLNSKTADASQSASWVLANEYGVCDELTNLFIGLCRALGIPARFVSGMSYADSEDWGAHGWAEVYFEGHGWIPFDVTYGELGYVDATHIKLKHALDANRSSTKYEWEGYNIGLDFGKLDVSTKVIDSKGITEPLVELDARVLKPETGFDSYNALIAEIRNPHDYYVPVQLLVSRSEGIEFFDEHPRFVLLSPGETREETWILRLLDGLVPGYLYNFTMVAYTSRNLSSVANIMSQTGYKEYSLTEIRDELENLQEESIKTYSENVDIDCDAMDVYYLGDPGLITCRLHNTGNVVLRNLSVCLDECKTIDLFIGQETSVSFPIVFDQEGQMDRQILARNQQVTKAANVRYSVWSRPYINITDLAYPEKTRFSDNFTVGFKISPQTSIPENVRVMLTTDAFKNSWEAEKLENPRSYILHVGPNTLAHDVNDFQISVEYQDRKGQEYSTTKDFRIGLYDVTLKEKGIMLLNSMGNQYHLAIAVMSIFVAGLVLGVIFRRKQ